MLSLSPAEAVGTFNGFIIASIIQSMLVWIPRLLMVTSTLVVAYRFQQGGAGVQQAVIRLAAGITILALFWPGVVTSPTGRLVSASEFVSAAAQADGAPIQSAADSPVSVSETQIPIGPAPRLIVEFLSEGWLNIALAIRSEALKPFSSVQPLQWLMQQGLTAGNVALIRDWTEKCVIPAQRRVLETTDTPPTFTSMLPFDGSPVSGAMSSIPVMPMLLSAQLGALSPLAGGETNCSAYTDTVISSVENEIAALISPGGQPLTALWEDEVGVPITDVVQRAIMMEVLRTGDVVPAPSLRGIFLTSHVTQTLASGAKDATIGLLSGQTGAVVAAGAGAVSNQLIAATNAILSLVGPALLVTEFAPDLLGMAMTVMIGGMPILLCYVLIPGRQAILTPVVSYFVVLALLYSSPVWWAVIELTAATAEQTNAPLMGAPLAWAKAKASGLLYRTIGIGVVVVSLATVVSLAAGVSGLAIVRSLRRV